MTPLSRPASDRAAAAPFAALFAESAGALPGADVAWLASLRRAAAERAADLGLPTQQAEAWRKTSLRALAKQSYALPRDLPAGIDRAPRLLDDAERLVFVEGLYSEALSTPGEAEVLSALLRRDAEGLRDALGDEPLSDALGALNLALFQDGARLTVPAGKALARPLELSFLNGLAAEALTAHPRLEIALGDNASAVVVEQHLGLGGAPRFVNHAARISVGRGARLVHLILLAEGADTTHLADTRVGVAQDGRYESYVLFAGGGLCRRALRLDLAGRGAQGVLNGGYLLTGKQQGDLASLVRHGAPDTTSRSVVKGALADEARQVFQGCIEVAEGASRADGRLSNKTLLLSDRAEIDSKPELRIFHDDVQCAHGATSGKLDEAALFYLRSRGLPLAFARRLLIGSFLAETLEGFDPALAGPLSQRIETRLQEIAL